MRRTLSLSRGAKGYNWYTKFQEKGADGFKKNLPPTPFDWSSPPKPRPHAYFDLNIENEPLGRIEFELAEDIVPKTVENFRLLCTGKGLKFPGYKGTIIHQVQKNQFMMAGDVQLAAGAGSHSASSERFFPDENYIIPHSAKGLVSMASVGVGTNGSQFYISLSSTPQLNGRCVVFGRVSKGLEVLESIEKLFCFRGVPARKVTVMECGIV